MSEKSLSETEYDAITDAAAQWCMRLHASDCTDDEREAFTRWHDAHPLHAFEYAALLEIWDVAEYLPHTPVAEVIALKPRPRAWRGWAVAAAICLAALPLAAFTGWQAGWLPKSYERYEAQASQRQVTLPDGSKVELNLGTQLTFSDYKNERRVTLNRGEAFFDVSHNATHPFVVRAGSGQIKVTGTQFNVWKLDGKVQVILLRGSVLVNSDSSHAGLALTPGMQASYSSGDLAPLIAQTPANDPALAWRDGKLILNNLPLSDALPLINRYLNKPLMLADASTGSIRIGGIYNTREISGLITSLPKVLPVYLTQNQDGNPVLNSIPKKTPKG